MDELPRTITEHAEHASRHRERCYTAVSVALSAEHYYSRLRTCLQASRDRRAPCDAIHSTFTAGAWHIRKTSVWIAAAWPPEPSNVECST